MKNTHFVPCPEINYHSSPCFYNVILVKKNYIVLFRDQNNKISPIIPEKYLTDYSCHEVLEIGTFYGEKCGVIELDCENFNNSDIFEIKPIRDALKLIAAQDEITAISRALKFIHWLQHRQYCGFCGNLLTTAENETAKICKICNSRFYPTLAPAVIVAITRGNQILLAHNHRFKEGMYSLIAGFVECGETLEQAVKREVFEEVGLQVKNIKYFASQPWPFPNSLMVGFTAEYESGEIVIENRELADAQWFDFDKLPLIPTHETIARRLIDHAIKK